MLEVRLKDGRSCDHVASSDGYVYRGARPSGHALVPEDVQSVVVNHLPLDTKLELDPAVPTDFANLSKAEYVKMVWEEKSGQPKRQSQKRARA